LALAVAGCSLLEKKKVEPVAEVSIVVGDVSLNRGGGSHHITVGMPLLPRDAIVTGGGSKVKISSGPIGIFVNEMASFRFLQPTEAESCVISVEKGGYYFSVPAGERGMQCRFGDMTLNIASGTDAALTINASGRLAEFFVLDGYALTRRGGEAKKLSACKVVVLDAAGMSEDNTLMDEREAAIERLKGWVGETVVSNAVGHGRCRPGSEPEEVSDAPISSGDEKEPAVSPTLKDMAMPAPIAHVPSSRSGSGSDNEELLTQPYLQPQILQLPDPAPLSSTQPTSLSSTQPMPQTAQQAEGIMIDHIIGPRRIYSGEEFTLKCGTTGRAAVTGYVWRFDGGGDLLVFKTETPQITTTLEKTGEFVVTCEIIGDKGMLASQTVKIQVVVGQAAVSAGGPYKAMLNKPVKLLGSARSSKGKIARYEWYVTHSGTPDYVLTENAAVSHTFTKPGDHKAVFAARLADGSTSSDTATVSVATQRLTAKAGADVMSKPDAKVKLKGTNGSPDIKVVKYEWDFDGDGVFDWSSESSGEVERAFKDYAKPVFRVTDSEGNTAVDTMRVVICPKDMATVSNGKFCVDKYEWPNKRGDTPLTNVSWPEAAKACESVGKRLCSPDEWKRACRNGGDYRPADGKTYPYGDEFSNTKCNTLDNPKSKNALIPSGILSECTGALGVYDMSGNTSEWTAPLGASAKAQAFGGFYQSGEEESGCESSVMLDKDKKYLYTGFRCCK
jgi:hypothetical protein